MLFINMATYLTLTVRRSEVSFPSVFTVPCYFSHSSLWDSVLTGRLWWNDKSAFHKGKSSFYNYTNHHYTASPKEQLEAEQNIMLCRNVHAASLQRKGKQYASSFSFYLLFSLHYNTHTEHRKQWTKHRKNVLKKKHWPFTLLLLPLSQA